MSASTNDTSTGPHTSTAAGSGAHATGSAGESRAAAGLGVRVEFFGVARLAAGAKAVVLPHTEAQSLRDVVGALAVRYPALAGTVVAPGERRLLDGYIFNLNGRDFVPDLSTGLRPGDTVLLVSAVAGG